MFRINPLTLFGSILVSIGVFSPWFSFNIPIKHGDSTYVNAVAHCSISPCVLTINMTSTSAQSIFVDIEVLDCRRTYFYRALPSLVGLACIAGAVLGPIGEFLSRLKLTLGGGGLTLVSILSFFLFLPSYIAQPRHDWSLAWGFLFTILGAMLILLSVGFRLLMSQVMRHFWNKSWEYR